MKRCYHFGIFSRSSSKYFCSLNHTFVGIGKKKEIFKQNSLSNKLAFHQFPRRSLFRHFFRRQNKAKTSIRPWRILISMRLHRNISWRSERSMVSHCPDCITNFTSNPTLKRIKANAVVLKDRLFTLRSDQSLTRIHSLVQLHGKKSF